ncbi:MAG: ABC transporter permease [Candidatus Omnitrophica bacterium]|nr:ABC transporter permease [Candidatus Omnitrophota bacterium]
MRRFDLILRGLVFHWRSHLGVFLGVVVGTAVLTGALLVGDCLDKTLRRAAEQRLGKTELALVGQDRFFRAALAEELAEALRAPVVPLLVLTGSVSEGDSSARANRVRVLGVDSRFWDLSVEKPPEGADLSKGVALNRRLAKHLGASVGDEIVIRVEKPDELPLDAPLATEEDSTTAWRVEVSAIVSDSSLGPFSLEAHQIPPLNLFLPLQDLQTRVDHPGGANLLLVGASSAGKVNVEAAYKALRETWDLADASLELREAPVTHEREFRTSRIFLDPGAAEAVLQSGTGASRVFTYFVNSLRLGEKATPYSMVTGLDRIRSISGENLTLGEDEILINAWLAEDLGAKVGDSIELAYYVLGPMRKLIEKTRSFRVRALVPMEGEWIDAQLMPDYPGLSKAENCRDWEPGFTIELDRIRTKDEDYWDNYRGAPKAFVALAAAQEMWTNRFGNLTAIRFPADTNPRATLESSLLSRLEPRALSLQFRDVRAGSQTARANAMDFGPLFLGFSFFLILSALLLVGLLNVFGVEQRGGEIGALAAMGFPRRLLARLLVLEGAALALLGSLCGVALAFAYTKGVLIGLSTLWRGAIGSGLELSFHASPAGLVLGGTLGAGMALAAIALATRRQARRPARELLARSVDLLPEMSASGGGSSLRSLALGLVLLAAALGLSLSTDLADAARAAETFFGVGFLVLLAGLFLVRALLARWEMGGTGGALSFTRLWVGNLSRRRGRSLACVALLACGCFLVIAVGANRRDAAWDADQRSSGTGGFTFLGESTFPLLHDLNTEEGLNQYGLSKADLPGVAVAPIRVHQGEDASCLNLNRAAAPTLLGIDPSELAKRGAFTFASTLSPVEGDSPWALLNRPLADGTIPAVVDKATLQWALHASLGDTLTYSDEKGEPFRVRFVGTLANSILQGSILISEENLLRGFPSESGYRMALIDAPREKIAQIGQTLSRSLSDLGLDLIPAEERLAAFNAVENAYLSIFQVLGGLGLILGSVGLGIVVLRNALERRAELALLRAAGFSERKVLRLVLAEHRMLLILGLGCGSLAGLASVLPHLISPGVEFPALSLAVTLVAIVGSGMIWIRLAAGMALCGPILDALRNE